MKNDEVKLKIFRGNLFDEDGSIKFLDQNTNKIDKGYETIVNRNEFEKLIKVHALHQGMKVDAFDKDDNLFWSNYREVKSENKLELLKAEYESLSGEKPKGTWGEKKLNEEIKTLKEK